MRPVKPRRIKKLTIKHLKLFTVKVNNYNCLESENNHAAVDKETQHEDNTGDDFCQI